MGPSPSDGRTVWRNDYPGPIRRVIVLKHVCTFEKPPFWRSSPAPGESSYRSGRKYDFVVRNARDCYSGSGSCSPGRVPLSRSSALYGFLYGGWNVDSTVSGLTPFEYCPLHHL